MIEVRTFDHAMRAIDWAEAPSEGAALTAARALVEDAYELPAAMVQGWRASLQVAFYVEGELVRIVPASVVR